MKTVAIYPPLMRARRGGFTLIELLVVIAIIGVLTSLTTAGVYVFIGQRKGHNTEATILTVTKILQKHWSEVIREAKNEAVSQVATNLATNNGLVSDPNGGRARIIWIKARLAEAFPVSYAEITGASNMATCNPAYRAIAGTANGKPYDPAPQTGIIPTKRRKYNNLNNGLNNGLPAPTTYGTYGNYLKQNLTNPGSPGNSAACLLLALGADRGGVKLSPDMLGSSGAADTDNDGLSEVIDGWRQPMVFFRFASEFTNPKLHSANPAPNAPDSLDPGGLLLNKTWLGTPIAAQYQGTGGPPNFYQNGIFKYPLMLGMNYNIPVLVSAGADGLLGLNADLSYVNPLNPVDDIDNLYSFQVRTP
jgi:prepilin-type N-terminal cleavage/methylation domain-containing protein